MLPEDRPNGLIGEQSSRIPCHEEMQPWEEATGLHHVPQGEPPRVRQVLTTEQITRTAQCVQALKHFRQVMPAQKTRQ
jgi:hypothetical protein